MADRPPKSSECGTEFKHGIYLESIYLIRRCLPIILLACAAQFSVLSPRYMYNEAALIAGQFLIWTFVFFTVLEAIHLPQEQARRQDIRRFAGFALLFALVILIPALLFLLSYYVLAELVPFEDPWGLLGFCWFTIWLIVAGIFGPVLPAFISDRGWNAALGTGMRQFSWIAGRMIAGPGLVMAVAVMLVTLYGVLTPEPIRQAASLYLIASFAWATVLTAIIFSRALLRDGDISPDLFE